MTPAQLAAIKSDVQNNATVYDGNTLAQWWAAGNPSKIAAYYKQMSSPDFWVYRTSIQPDEYRKAIVWTEVDQMQAGKARIWEWITARMTLPIDVSDPAVRQGLNDAFGNSTTKTQMLAIASRNANLIEKLLADVSGGSGASQTPGASGPATMTFEGAIEWSVINEAMAS